MKPSYPKLAWVNYLGASVGCLDQKSTHHLLVTPVPEILICTFMVPSLLRALFMKTSVSWCFRNWQPVHPFCEHWSHSNCNWTSSRAQPTFEALSLRHATRDLFLRLVEVYVILQSLQLRPRQENWIQTLYAVVAIPCCAHPRSWKWKDMNILILAKLQLLGSNHFWN